MAINVPNEKVFKRITSQFLAKNWSMLVRMSGNMVRINDCCCVTEMASDLAKTNRKISISFSLFRVTSKFDGIDERKKDYSRDQDANIQILNV